MAHLDILGSQQPEQIVEDGWILIRKYSENSIKN